MNCLPIAAMPQPLGCRCPWIHYPGFLEMFWLRASRGYKLLSPKKNTITFITPKKNAITCYNPKKHYSSRNKPGFDVSFWCFQPSKTAVNRGCLRLQHDPSRSLPPWPQPTSAASLACCACENARFTTKNIGRPWWNMRVKPLEFPFNSWMKK